MTPWEYEEAFRPDLNASFEKRLALFESELLYVENFLKGIIAPNRLWDEYHLSPKHVEAKLTAAFGFRDASKLDYKTKEQLFEIFFKHFPEGVQASLVGDPQTLPRY
jgi:hypothetical protein